MARRDKRPITNRAPEIDRAHHVSYIWPTLLHTVRLPSYDPAWIASLTRSVQQLRATGAQVLVLGPIPYPQSNVPVCLSEHLDDATACSPPRSEAVDDSGIAAEAVAVKAGGGQYADLTELFCTAERCPGIVGITPVYLDRYHATIEYAALLAPVLGTLADRAVAAG